MIIQKESYNTVKEEIFKLINAHSSEIDLYMDKLVLSPRDDIYSTADLAGLLHLYTCRDEDYSVVGYAAFIVDRHPHYSDSVYANNDLLYIVPEQRGSGLFQKLFKFVEDDLADYNVEVITFNFKTNHDHPQLATSMGYDRAEIVYSKYIGSK